MAEVCWAAEGGAMSGGPASLTGGCRCKAVRYEVADAFEYALNCHCSQCRRATGAAFKSLAGIPRGRLALTAGEDGLLIDGALEAAHDVRCGVCGSLLYSVVREGAYVHVAMGTLMDEPSIRPAAHIFVGSKAKWYEITDGLPRFEQFPEG